MTTFVRLVFIIWNNNAVALNNSLRRISFTCILEYTIYWRAIGRFQTFAFVLTNKKNWNKKQFIGHSQLLALERRCTTLERFYSQIVENHFWNTLLRWFYAKAWLKTVFPTSELNYCSLLTIFKRRKLTSYYITTCLQPKWACVAVVPDDLKFLCARRNFFHRLLRNSIGSSRWVPSKYFRH